MSKRAPLGVGVSFLVLSAVPSVALAQAPAPAQDSEQALREADAGYWHAYNACDAAAMAPYFSEDFEFYHDKGGATRSRSAMIDQTMKGICGNPNARVRREVDSASVRYDPIPGYGGVLSGQHRFYMTEKGMPERLSGTARFVMLWHYASGRWELTRALSLDHEPVAYQPPSPGIMLSTDALQRYAGRYEMPKTGEITLVADGNKLVLTTANLHLSFAPAAANHFIGVERPLQLYFSGSTGGKAVDLIVVENGNPVESGKRAK